MALIPYVCGEQEYLWKPQGKFQIFDGKREINVVCMKIERGCFILVMVSHGRAPLAVPSFVELPI